ncbi:MAG: hypothetical protein ACLQU3_18350 [Limisphaerales bacterium]
MVSYAYLGDLGAREGIPVAHTWEPPPPEPPPAPVTISISISAFLSLLILLPLFLFRPNRCSAAWWIWLPAVISALAGSTITCLMGDNDRTMAQAVDSFIVGLAALWLLMPFLGSRYRIVTFSKALPVLAGFSLLAFVPTLLARQSGWLDFRLYLAAVLALASLTAALALTFGGLSVRRRFGRARFLFWLAGWTMVAWTLIASPFVIIGSRNGDIEWGASFLAVLYATAISLALLLPLVLLSFFQPFYRARLFGFLKVPQPGPSAGAAVPPKLPDVYQLKGTATAVGTGK